MPLRPVGQTPGGRDLHEATCRGGHAPRHLGSGSEVMPGPWRAQGWLRLDSQWRSEWEVRNGDGPGRLFSSGFWLRKGRREVRKFLG